MNDREVQDLRRDFLVSLAANVVVVVGAVVFARRRRRALLAENPKPRSSPRSPRPRGLRVVK